MDITSWRETGSIPVTIFQLKGDLVAEDPLTARAQANRDHVNYKIEQAISNGEKLVEGSYSGIVEAIRDFAFWPELYNGLCQS